MYKVQLRSALKQKEILSKVDPNKVHIVTDDFNQVFVLTHDAVEFEKIRNDDKYRHLQESIN